MVAQLNNDPETITRRAHLREKYIVAQAGITGADFVCSDTDRLALVGIEKIIPQENDLAVSPSLQTSSKPPPSAVLAAKSVRAISPSRIYCFACGIKPNAKKFPPPEPSRCRPSPTSPPPPPSGAPP